MFRKIILFKVISLPFLQRKRQKTEPVPISDPQTCLYYNALTQFKDLHGKTMTCSISYAWEPESSDPKKNEAQRQWITRFANHLETAGCSVTRDLWDNLHSGNISRFVENVVTRDRVFLIGTPLLKLKAEQTSQVVHAEINALIDRFQNEPEKLYLIVRDGEHSLAFPEAFKDNASTDMRQESHYPGALMDMLAKAFGIDGRHPAFEQIQDIKTSLVKAASEATKQLCQLRHLPVLNCNFVGRERELAQLGQRLREVGLYQSYVRNAHEEAIAYLIESVAICREVYGEGYTATAISYYEIGRAYQAQGKLSEAMCYYLKALEIQEALLGERYASTASACHNIGLVYQAQGNLSEARHYYQKALDIKEAFFGDRHPATAITYHNIGRVYQDQGNLSKAMRYYQKALRIEEALLGERHTTTAITYHNIGQVYQDQGNLSEAMCYYQKALRIEEALLGDFHPATASTYHEIGWVYHDQGNHVESLQFIQKSYDILLALLGSDHPHTINVKNNLNLISNLQQN